MSGFRRLVQLASDFCPCQSKVSVHHIVCTPRSIGRAFGLLFVYHLWIYISPVWSSCQLQKTSTGGKPCLMFSWYLNNLWVVTGMNNPRFEKIFNWNHADSFHCPVERLEYFFALIKQPQENTNKSWLLPGHLVSTSRNNRSLPQTTYQPINESVILQTAGLPDLVIDGLCWWWSRKTNLITRDG